MKEYRININGTIYNVSIEEVGNGGTTTQHVATPAPQVAPAPQAATVPSPPKATTPPPAPAATPVSSGETKTVKSPLPGIILDIFVNVGDTVKAGQKIVLLEAMKMENDIEVEMDGVVKEIKVNKGDTVYEGDILLTIG